MAQMKASGCFRAGGTGCRRPRLAVILLFPRILASNESYESQHYQHLSNISIWHFCNNVHSWKSIFNMYLRFCLTYELLHLRCCIANCFRWTECYGKSWLSIVLQVCRSPLHCCIAVMALSPYVLFKWPVVYCPADAWPTLDHLTDSWKLPHQPEFALPAP